MELLFVYFFAKFIIVEITNRGFFLLQDTYEEALRQKSLLEEKL